MTTHIKELVSKQKRRFVQDGFNLDLTYISDRVIAMGFPATSLEAIYRNSIDEVRRMLESKHKDHYKLYNLCSERSYDPQKFQNRVAYYPFDDHNPPEFGMMKPFCEDVDKWLKENERNVAAVHCKAGKGRTGLMICAYLLHCRHSLTAEEVLNYYATTRTMDTKGVTIPSQRRYVDYYAAMLNENLLYSPVKLYLYSFVIDPLPSLGLGQQEGYIQFEVRQTSVRPYESQVYQVKRTDGRINIVLHQPLLIVGDVKIEFFQNVFNFGKGKGRKFLSKVKLFHFWVNTFFIDLERSNPLTHDISQPTPEELFSMNLAPCLDRSSALTHESLSSRPSLPVVRSVPATATAMEDSAPADRNCRSTHNSGGNGSSDTGHDFLPPPRQLRAHLSVGPESRDFNGEADLVRTSNGSCLASVQTIHSHPPARTVSIMEPVKQEQRIELDCDKGVKLMSISDDTLTDQGAQETTQSSFNSKRTRHSSVPMTSKTGLANPTTRFTRHIPGKLMSVRLRKSQIDKADKDKGNRFSENFNVTLFLVRPNDQKLQEEFHRPNFICQHAESNGTGKDCTDGPYPADAEPSDWSDKDGSDDDAISGPEAPDQDHEERGEMGLPPSSRQLAAALSGMVRNQSEPGNCTLSHLEQEEPGHCPLGQREVDQQQPGTHSLPQLTPVSYSTWI